MFILFLSRVQNQVLRVNLQVLLQVFLPALPPQVAVSCSTQQHRHSQNLPPKEVNLSRKGRNNWSQTQGNVTLKNTILTYPFNFSLLHLGLVPKYFYFVKYCLIMFTAHFTNHLLLENKFVHIWPVIYFIIIIKYFKLITFRLSLMYVKVQWGKYTVFNVPKKNNNSAEQKS